ncbi:hypothetical protein M758_4G177700 [Ceratodon purpureus]|uniref:Uncharacterized protein n=1 Tax=Ceratodon purpureus TaxID=3225 RepID=A0A8T0IC11_CERPU|nr:hypothetical protein KC19_4G175600 [Ceratodon purpureus]KAG0619952.1 hypothetical protein M758_4G177700 [Ceratodon purpureus]
MLGSWAPRIHAATMIKKNTPACDCFLPEMHPCRLTAINLSKLLQGGNVKTQAAMTWYYAGRQPGSGGTSTSEQALGAMDR